MILQDGVVLPMSEMKKPPIIYDDDTQRFLPVGGGTTTFTSNPIRNCCGGGPSNQQRSGNRSATLNYRTVPSCPNIAKSASLGRDSVYYDNRDIPEHDSGYREAIEGRCHYLKLGTCDVVKSGMTCNVPDTILWKFDATEDSSNSPDVIGRTLPDAIISTTTL